MRVRLRPKDAASGGGSMVKAWAWGALVVLALSYCAPYSYSRSAPGRPVGAWAAEVPEAHRVTVCVAAACLLTLLAVRAGRTPGIVILPMYAAAAVGLCLALVASFGYPGNPTHKAGPGVRMQGLAAILAFVAVVEAGGLRKPSRRGRSLP